MNVLSLLARRFCPRGAASLRAAAALGLAAFATVASAQTFSNLAPIAIPNAGVLQGPASPYPSAVNVSGVGTQLVSISVTLSNFSHVYPADVDVLLVGPLGQNVLLMSDVGTFLPVSGLNFTFTNSAGPMMPSNAQLTSGTFAPSNFDQVGNVDGFAAPAPLVGPYGSSFAQLIGTNPNGTWSLYVIDDVAGNDGQFAGGWSMTITAEGTPQLLLVSAASRKSHANAGEFDINLPLVGEPGVECRDGAGAHMLVFNFTNPIVSGNVSVTSGTATAWPPTFTGNTMMVTLTEVTDVQTIGVTLTGVTDSFSQVLPNTVVQAHILLGDSTGNKTVNASDVGQTKAESGATVARRTFRTDFNTNGAINSSDVGQVKATSGNAITAAPSRSK
jgi:subtilisin-like proprotein convertase family protein